MFDVFTRQIFIPICSPYLPQSSGVGTFIDHHEWARSTSSLLGQILP